MVRAAILFEEEADNVRSENCPFLLTLFLSVSVVLSFKVEGCRACEAFRGARGLDDEVGRDKGVVVGTRLDGSFLKKKRKNNRQ